MNWTVILAFLSAICGAFMALFVAWFDRRSVTRWSFVFGMVVLVAERVLYGLIASTSSPEQMIYWQSWRLVAASFLPGAWLLFSLTYGRGNYREFLNRWSSVLAAAFLIPTGLALAFRTDLVNAVTGTTDGRFLTFGLSSFGQALNGMCLLGAVLVLMNLEKTFRASVGTIRWRIKFMLLGVGVLFAVRAYVCSQALLFRSIDVSLRDLNSAALCVAFALMVRSLLRAGNFTVDVYPSQSVIQHSLTVLLAGIYLLIVGVFAKVVASMGGDSFFTLEAFLVLLALVVLTALLLSERIRLRMKRFVSRHFSRPLYDYRTIWRSFTEGTASCVEQNELSRAVVKLVADIFQVLSATIWLVDDSKEKLVYSASTSLTPAKGADLTPQTGVAVEIIQALHTHPEPVDIDASSENWAVALRRCQPDDFRQGGSRMCVPLVASGEVLGVMILGDRVSGVPFLQQDFDLLKCIGDEVGASLCNIQLSRKLLQAKELEAFQAMSAFFVHDLKNTASTLNLMLKNLPVHFENPAFREDALRGISRIVTHINDLIKQLSLLRHESKLQRTEADLTNVISNALTGLESDSKIELIKDLKPVPKVFADQEQLGKVIINLVLNAKEAIASTGQIHITTSHNNGWTILTVRDNGQGMSREFLNQSLFRPFQTTKKNGFGIGMFQSKLIVEAHGGRIEAESEPGKGTTFRIFLPIQKQIR